MQRPQPKTVTLDDVLITEELSRRSPRPPNWQAENQAMHTLARQLVNQPETMLQTLVDIALGLCGAGTAGVSLLETTVNGEEFRWTVLAGTLAQYVGGTTPCNFSPCGVCLERGTPVLFAYPERYFTYFQAANTPIVEGLVLPLIADNHALGTIWIMSHDQARQFDSEDVRVMTSLADFTAAALLLNQRQTYQLSAKNAQLETEADERRRAEKSLRESEERYRLFVTASSDIVYRMSADWREMLSLEGKNFLINTDNPSQIWDETYIPLEEQPRVWATIQDAIRTKSIFELEHRVIQQDGAIGWTFSRVIPMLNEQGDIMEWFGTASDITDRKRSEEASRESEERFRTLANTAPALIWYNDAQGNNRFLNQYFLDFTGKNAEQIRGEGWHDLIHPDDAEFYIADYLAAVREQRSWHNRNRIRRHDGVWRWHDNYAQPLFNADGVYLGHVGVTIDNTDTIAAETALRESEAKYRSLFNAMDEGYMLSEVIFDENDKPIDILYLEANPAAIRLAGRDFSGQLMREIDPNYEEYWYEIYGRIALTGVAVRAERYAEPHGRWFDFYAFKVGERESCRVATVFQDITDRKRTEEALRESEERLRDVLNSMTEGFALLGGDFTILDVNEETLRLDGRSRDELIGRSHWDAFPGTEDSSVGEIFRRVARERVPASLEHMYRWPDDRSLWLDMRVYPTRNDGVAIFWRDVTNRKQAEAALRESEEKYRLLFNSMDEAYAVVEVMTGKNGEWNDFLFLEVNPAFVKQTGMEYPVGRKATELLGTPNPTWAKIYGQVAETGEPIRFEEGEATLGRVFDLYVFRLGGEGSRRVAVLFTDITDRKLTEEQLRHAAKMDAFRVKLSDALRPLFDAVEIQATVTHTTMKFFGADRCYYCEIIDGSAIIRRDASQADLPTVVGAYPLENSPIFRAMLDAGQLFVFEDVRTTNLLDENLIQTCLQLQIISGINVPVIKQGEPVGILAITQTTPRNWTEFEMDLAQEIADRTWATIERTRAEANLREAELQQVREQAEREQERQRAETLAELDRAKTNFFSNVSHEFRTPLTLLLAPLQDALSDRTLPPIHRERLELAHRNSLRLLKLVNTLLDFSRIEAGRMEAVYEPTDLSTFTAELASVFRSAIEQAGLQLIVDCLPLPEPVYVDREMWEKIVLNLISNAFKFTLTGEIIVRLHPVDHHVIFEVQDTGIGIAPEELPHLFERFYQVRGTQARSHEGSGIGLALVHELVQLQGGTINVRSTPCQGSCFTITLPFGVEHLPQERIKASRTLTSTSVGATAYVQETELWLPTEAASVEFSVLSSELEQNSLIQNSQTARILLVDDNPDIRDYLTRILSKHAQVTAVADGSAALSSVQAQLPDLILSDVMMPNLDGFELLQALRSDPRTREIPIILLSARAGEEAIVAGLEAGADDYLIKPFSAQELVSRVNAHLQTAKQRSVALHEARTTLRQKDELLSTISHELNTPLVSILGWTRLLRSNPPNLSMLTKALETIERNAMLQAKLVQDLLDISRISAGKLRLHPQPVELESVIETAIAAVLTAAIAKNIHVEFAKLTKPALTSVSVLADGDRLQQVICNLLTNAIKFTPEQGQIAVKLEVICSDTNQLPITQIAQITITDTGIGIAPEFLPHIFDRFRQAESGLAGGLGLGLAIAQHLVELHNGTIHAYSAGKGQGSTFVVRLPLLNNSKMSS